MTPEQQNLSDQLTNLQRKYVIHLIDGKMSQREAYIAAGGKAKEEDAQDANASRMLSTDKVKAFYDSLIGSMAKSAVMTRQEALEALTRIARTSVKDVANFSKVSVGEDSQGNETYQSVWDMKNSESITDDQADAISEISSSREGLKFKLHSRPAAIKQIAEMEGWNSPARHELSGPGGGPIETTQKVIRVRSRKPESNS